MIIARQSTARTVTVGPILNDTGVAVTTAVVGDLKISKNGGAPAALNGSATLTHRHTGHYSLALTATDLDTVGQAEVVIDSTTNAMPIKPVTVVEEAVYDAIFAASAAGYQVPIWSSASATVALTNTTVATVTTTTTATTATNLTNLPSIPANWLTAAGIAASALNGKGDWNVGKTGYALTATTGLGNQTANITGNLSGSVGSVTGAVGSVTGNVGGSVASVVGAVGGAVASVTGNVGGSVGSVTGAVGSVTGSVGSIATGGITSTSFAASAIDSNAIATNAIGANELDATAATEIATAVWALATRTLTAGTNIALAKGTGVTGFNDLDAGGVATAVWNAATATYGSAGSYGLLIETNLDAAISSRSTYAGADTSGTTTLLSRLTATRAGYLDNISSAAPSAAAIADAVWDEVQSGHTSAGTFGLYLDAAVSTVGGGSLTTAAIADAVWDEVLSGHLTGGSTGASLNAAGSAGDPWTTTLPGSYTGSQAGKIIADILTDTAVIGAAGAGLTAVPWNAAWDAEVQSEAADALTAYGASTLTTGNIPTAAAVASQVRTELTTDLARVDVATSTRLATAGYSAPLDAAATRTAVGLTTANLDTQLALRTGYKLASDGLDSVVVESGVNARQAISVIAASAAGVLSGAATTAVAVKGANSATTRIAATVDADGNRSAVTLTLPS
jgi:hypothetical protein